MPPHAFSTDSSVAIVIVNKDAGLLLHRTLAALESQSVAPGRVLVVDNASEDGSVDGIEVRFSGIELEVHRLAANLGFAGGNNYGVRAAEGYEWVALLNPDAFPEPTWLEQLLAATAEHPEFTFFGSRLLDVASVNRLDGTGDVYHVSGLAWRRDHGRRVHDGESGEGEIFSPCAAAALYRREAFLDVGGFDESFFCYYEDSDLSFRLRLSGHRCRYVPGAVVHHVGSATTGRLSDFTLYHSLRNDVWTWTKNMPAPLVWRYLPQHLLANLMTVIFFSITGRARPVLAGKRDAVRGLPRILQERRRIQRQRTVGVAELARRLDRGPGAYLTGVGRAIMLSFPKRRPS